MKIEVYFTNPERRAIRRMVKPFPPLFKWWKGKQAYLWTCVRTNKSLHVRTEQPDLVFFVHVSWTRFKHRLQRFFERIHDRDAHDHCYMCAAKYYPATAAHWLLCPRCFNIWASSQAVMEGLNGYDLQHGIEYVPSWEKVRVR